MLAFGIEAGARQPEAKPGLPATPAVEKKLAGKVVPLVLLMPWLGITPLAEKARSVAARRSCW